MLDGQVGQLLALENPAGVFAAGTPHISKARPIAHQSAGRGRQAPHLNKNREPYCSKLQVARFELVAWGDQAAIWNNDAIKMLIMTKTKDGPEFASDYSSAKALERIAAALEQLAGAQAGPCDFGAADAFFFAGTARVVPVPRVNRVDIGLLRGIDQARDTLLANTERFAQGFAAIIRCIM